MAGIFQQLLIPLGSILFMSYINEDMYTEIFTNYLGFESIREKAEQFESIENIHVNFINSNKIFEDEI